jgi:acetate kinase
MNILVVNSGSSSIKFSIFAASSPADDPEPFLDGELSGIGTPSPTLDQDSASEPVQASDPVEAIHVVLDTLTKPGLPAVDAIGYRVVHPGPKLNAHQRITEAVLTDLEAAIPFAPLHDPEAVQLIRAAMQRFPRIPHFACFDTVFHQTMPPEAFTYPIPLGFLDQGVRRYGFHGLSCESVVHQMRKSPGVVFPQRMIVAHLGSGCSVTAILDGKSVDTTMGLTPTGGVVMGTRPGDLDPGLIFYLLRQPGATIESVEHMLNHDSGIKALFGTNDMRKLRETAGRDRGANLALKIFLTSVRKAIAGFAAVHGLDALVFTGGIGEHDSKTRWALGNGLNGDQPEIAFAVNEASLHGLRKISDEESNIAVYVVPAQEDLMIAIHVAQMLERA